MNLANRNFIDHKAKRVFLWLGNSCLMFLFFFAPLVHASEVEGIGRQLEEVATENFGDIVLFMTGLAYVFGVLFAVLAIYKFREHKDNPSQIKLGSCVLATFVAVSLLYIGYIIQVTGFTFYQNIDADSVGNENNDGTWGRDPWGIDESCFLGAAQPDEC